MLILNHLQCPKPGQLLIMALQIFILNVSPDFNIYYSGKIVPCNYSF